MSTVRTLSKPAARAIATAPSTPAAGPESIVRTLCSPAARAVIRPPLLCMMWSPAGTPIAADPLLEVADVAAHDRHDVGVRGRRRGALELAELGDDRRTRARPRPPGSASAISSPRRRSWAGFAYEWSRQTASAVDALRARGRDRGASACSSSRRRQHLARVEHPLAISNVSSRGHERRGALGEPVVELGPVLAADLEHVAEALA